ncbi:glycosyltransferase [Marinitenerispora sediminis]|uniref:Glycosyl transferase n=1 Tax=Marinitenerispora sediminis TaxID=1931232 RepID=A0A368T8C8_9ACTN|nr:glycosyltransferase [Marinitenerispora sediminis]RCV54340.1 glycosyl transferase [Marinitenerispora sediminis]RCV60529.1 glycosyl transferase [Marinitenerispora sediminis]RCV61081.1 glycosyl transferase [Marinitenerispora sediminis]
MTQGLAAAGCEVTLLLKAPVKTDRLVAPLTGVPGVTLRRPYEEELLPDLGPRGLTPDQAVGLITRLDTENRFDLVVVRGRRAAIAAAQAEALAGRLWTYLTDVPQNVAELTSAAVSELTDIAVASRFLLCQTEELRDFLESSVPAACGKSVLFPPVVVVPEGVAGSGTPHTPLKLVYTGKFAPRWNTLEMTELPAALAAQGVPAELHMIGDKIHRDSPDWAKRMAKALEDTPDLVWHGGQSRAEALRLSAQCDIGLSWRAPEMDASLELSTKVLELGALGLPVVLNRTPMHEELLGADYPLYAGEDIDSVADVLALAADPDVYRRAAERCAAASAKFTLDRAAERLRGYLDLAFPAAPAGTSPDRPLRVVVAGHDLKFFTRLADHLMSLPGLEVRLDEWEALRTHDQYRSKELAAWADVVICEWCGPNALFYAQHKRPGQRLLVRLHRFELYAEWPRKLDIDKVDAVICVSPYYADLTRERVGWPADKIVVLPNWVDDEQLDRPKLAGAEYTLGMIGIAPSRKRIDRGLDVLAALRRRDPRYTLVVKTKQPWDYWWIWNRPEEREYYERTYRRIQRSDLLADGVVFDPFGPDVATWLRRIGFVISTSDDESFHLAPAEGAASGGVPAVLAWPGADTIYSRRWVHEDTDAMADAIHRIVSEGRFDAARAAARAEITEHYALRRVCQLWTDLVVDGTAPERIQLDRFAAVGLG